MRRSQAGLIALLLAAAITQAADFSGASALQLTGKMVAFGPRPAGSPAIEKLRAFLSAQLKPLGCEVIEDVFTAQTPMGPVEMKNVIARFPGSSGRAVVFSGHYDTKPMPGIRFVGANDGGSSAGLLLELARAIAGRSRKDDVYLVWFDGEEAIAQWSESDSLYGSRHLARKWADEGMLPKIRALINVDMTGDKDLGILQDSNSSAALRRLVWKAAADTGYGKYFLDSISPIEDDHMPFVRLGVNALDLIDFSYGPSHSWWHNQHDTLDKISAHSFDVVGNVLLEVLRRLEQ